MLGELQGSGVVTLHGVNNDGALVLEKAACSLADVLHERGPLPESEVRAVGAAAAAALARIHEAGLVHGDIKPANMLLSREGQLWLSDFEATAVADGQPLRHFSPGRLAPGTAALPESDVTALAVAMIELATGTLVDADVRWRAADLRRLGCPPTLSAEISLMFGDPATMLNAPAAAGLFLRSNNSAPDDMGNLPSPAVNARLTDPTPTLEFLPGRPRSPQPPQPAPSIVPVTKPWWQRLVASWQPQTSDTSQAKRSS